jgi:hypothetical protein
VALSAAAEAAGVPGTTGAVVSACDDTLLVEITGPGGKTLGTIPVPAAQLTLKQRSDAA